MGTGVGGSGVVCGEDAEPALLVEDEPDGAGAEEGEGCGSEFHFEDIEVGKGWG